MSEKCENSMAHKTGAKKKIFHWQKIGIYLAIYDFIAVCAAYFAGLWIRFDCRYSLIPKEY